MIGNLAVLRAWADRASPEDAVFRAVVEAIIDLENDPDPLTSGAILQGTDSDGVEQWSRSFPTDVIVTWNRLPWLNPTVELVDVD